VNINTIKTALSFSDYVNQQVKCDNTAWQLKFTNSWNECDYWGGYAYFSIIAQVYIFDIIFLSKETKFKFPLPVKSYTPEIFSNYIFNKVERPTINVKEFIVGNTFTLGQDLNSTEIKFYLNSDVKLSKANVLNKYKVVYLGNVSTIPISVYGYDSVNVSRYLNPTVNLSLNTTTFATDLRYINSSANYKLTISPTINNYRHLIPNANFSLVGLITILPNCKKTYWSRKFNSWSDCGTWS
jgi:hypothetical protein